MILKIDPFSGISGDMMLGALVDLAGGGDDLVALPARLGLVGASLAIGRTSRGGLACTQVEVLDETAPAARHLADIHAILDASDLDEPARRLARRIFAILGEAEAAVHGVALEAVHFHEVGAVDSILDIVGTALLVSRLEVSGVVCGPVCTGYGTVTCDHGRLPVPAPATERILHGMPTVPGEVAAEMTTPTGAAILRALEPKFTIGEHTTVASGYGAGSRDLAQPNCLRLALARPATTAAIMSAGEVWLVQANLDDTTGELLGDHLQRRLLDAGALDVTITPLVMKKGRPGHRLEVLVPAPARDDLAALILEETTTIGVRYFPVERTVLPRARGAVTTRWGEVAIKTVTLPSGATRHTPEYDDCVRCSDRAGVPLQRVMREAQRLADGRGEQEE
jgi:uncharacterized protein (TIGR00299 family) protein